MENKFAIRIICQIILVLIPFLFLINSINFLTSNLNKQNKILNNQKELLNARLERKKAEVGSDLSVAIEDRLKTGTIETVTPSGTTSIIKLQPKDTETLKPEVNSNSSVGNPTGITIR